MRKGRSTGKPTKEQVRRFEAIKEIGCVACLMLKPHGVHNPCDIHHQTCGGKHGQRRLGHDFTIGLCKWHHVGQMLDVCNGEPEEHAKDAWHFILGPSYALQPRLFRETFGSDDELLAYQNKLIEELRQ